MRDRTQTGRDDAGSGPGAPKVPASPAAPEWLRALQEQEWSGGADALQSSLPEDELLDPTPDIHELFQTFNHQYFSDRLTVVSVSWSRRMTLCAGQCRFNGQMCSIRLSTPLLQYRPRGDLIATLLHEMIHAFLFLTANTKDRSGHGPQFCYHMERINRLAGTEITVYHSFHDEVNHYQRYVWRCNGPCRLRAPYYGFVRRSMNRAPGKHDFWWCEHERSCGGAFVSDPPQGSGLPAPSVLSGPKQPTSQKRRPSARKGEAVAAPDLRQRTLERFVKRRVAAVARGGPSAATPASGGGGGAPRPASSASVKRGRPALPGMRDPYGVLEARRRREESVKKPIENERTVAAKVIGWVPVSSSAHTV